MNMAKEILAIIISILSFSGYVITNKRPFVHSWKTKLDEKIKLNNLFLIPYLGFFFYVALGYFLLKEDIKMGFLTSLTICNIAATIFWYFLPNGVTRPLLEKDDFASKIINFIYCHDGDTNGFPSAHVFSSIIASYYLSLQQTNLTWLFIMCGILISLSTVFTKQHYVLDILGGIIFASLAILTQMLLIS